VTADDDQAPPPPPPRPGASFFTIEGRAAPGLFVVGWLASLLGAACLSVGLLSGSGLFALLLGPGLLSLGLIAGAGNQALERRARGESYPGPSPFLVFAAAFFVVRFTGAILGLLLAGVLGRGGGDIPDPVVELIGALLTAALFIGVVRLVVVGTGALTWSEMQIRRFDRRALSDLGSGAALAVPTIGVTLILGLVLVSIFRVVSPSPLPPTGTTSGLILQLITAAIVAPVSEEILFRGFSVTAWERAIGPTRAIVRASLLFALAHVIETRAGSFPEALGLIVVGAGSRLPVAFALGWIFVRRRSIWASIGLHATFNATLVIVADLAVRSGGG
jgi:membrane protease YdiL (CAAX protease family)